MLQPLPPHWIGGRNGDMCQFKWYWGSSPRLHASSIKGVFSSVVHGFVKILFRLSFAQEKTFVKQLAKDRVHALIKEASRDK